MSWVIKETNKSIPRCVTTEKNTLYFLLYVKLPINAHQVYIIFEGTEYQLIHPAKEIFRKSPKMDFLKNILILPPDIYLIEFTQLTKKPRFRPTLTKNISHLMAIQRFFRPIISKNDASRLI